MSLTLKLYNLLLDGERHSNVELCNATGWRFGDKIHKLKKKGVILEKKKGDGYLEYWRLVSRPLTLTEKKGRLIDLCKNMKPIEVTIVEKGEVKQEFITNDTEKFLGSTNIPNPNYSLWSKFISLFK